MYKNIQNNSHFSNSNKNAISKKFLDKNYKKNFEFNLNFRSEPNFLDNYQKIEYLIKGAHSKEKLSKREDFDFLYNKNKKRNIYESVLNKNLKKKDSVKIIKIKEEQILINNEKKIIKKKPGLNSVFEKKDIFIFESSYNFIDKIYENIYLKKIQKNKKFSKKDKILLFNILYKSIEKSEILNHDFFYSSKKKINKIGEKSIKNELIFENLRSKNKITSEENAYVFKIFNKKFKIFKFKDKNLFGSKNLISKANYFYSKKYEEDLNYEKNKTFDNSNEIIFKKNHYEKNKKRNKTKFENIFLKNKNKELKEERKYILKFLESKISVTKLKDKNLFINTKNLIDESNIVYLKKRNDRITHKENSFIGSGSKKIVNIKKIKFVDNLIKSRIENNSEKNKRTLEYELDYKNISPNKIIYKKSNDIENILSKIKKIENENKKIRDDNENDRKSIDKLKFNYFKLVENKSKSKEDFATKKEVEKIVRSCIQGINFKSIVDFATEKLEKGLTIEKYRNGIL
ncbi:MAG: hypothetical protein CfP315_0715 [Candidatus Improbicoccus pseudotrichonymphae]|uniref:Uncharacterized protein n=1 Tax=Candidatus Improbicoccus pseudotrichonymphae TaxID=3033792 RepID=A0AA48KX81_9FIRM|nr:MAG: hypothetical protein CfP315_0715 [Candidatus Improbicoccus pseudotrichonymphae]